jgi:hypothetical protein
VAEPDPQVPHRRSRRRDTLALALLGGIVALYFLLPLSPATAGFPLDDGWIHAVYARSLAERGELAFNSGEASTGSTSLLWTAVLTAGRLAGFGPITAALLPAVIALMLLIAAWHLLLCGSGLPRLPAAFGAAALPLSGVAIWWTLSGMETVLFLLLATTAMLFSLRRRWLAAGIALALLILARPEGALLAPVLAAAAWQRERRAAPAFILLACAAAGAVAYAGVNLAVSGTLMSSTFEGRRWLATGGRPAAGDLLSWLSGLGSMLYRWLRLLGWGMLRDASSAVWTLAGAAGVILIFSQISAFLRRDAGRELSPGDATASFPLAGVLTAWSALHVLAYSLLLPYPGHAGRYLAPLLLPAALAFAQLLRSFVRNYFSPVKNNSPAIISHSRRVIPRDTGDYSPAIISHGRRVIPRDTGIYSLLLRRVLPGAVVLAAVVVTSFAGIGSWRDTWRSSVAHINRVHVSAAQWIADSTASGAVIAAYDIGALGYFGKRRVLDLGGLLHAGAVEHMRGDIDTYIAENGADYVAMVSTYAGLEAPGTIPLVLGYGRSEKLTRERKAAFSLPEAQYRRHISVTGNAYPRIIIEKITKMAENP